eukprot:1180357-Prorocentrum_minimum.AAC.4
MGLQTATEGRLEAHLLAKLMPYKRFSVGVLCGYHLPVHGSNRVTKHRISKVRAGHIAFVPLDDETLEGMEVNHLKPLQYQVDHVTLLR